MTALILHSAPFAELAVLKLRAVGQQIVSALDTFAETKMRNAVSEDELRRSRHDIDRYRRLIRASHAKPRQRQG